MKYACLSQGQGGDLVAVAAALSVWLARGRTSDQIELLAALFEIVGDNLGLLALQTPNGEAGCPGCQTQIQNLGR